MMRRWTVIALMAAPVYGQALPNDYSMKITELVNFYKDLSQGDRAAQLATIDADAVTPNRLGSYVWGVADVRKNLSYFGRYVAARQALVTPNSLGSFLGSAMQDRLDVQSGANAGSPGTTSVLTRAGASEVLSLALESGAVTQSVSGQSLTLSANALSLYRFVTTPRDVFQYCLSSECSDPLARQLDKISGTSTFSLTNANPQTVSGTVSGSGSSSTATTSAEVLIENNHSSLTGFTVRYQIHNTADLHNPKYISAWKSAVKTLDGAALDTQIGSAFNSWIAGGGASGTGAADYNAWFQLTKAGVVQALQAGSDAGALADYMTTQWDALIKTASLDPKNFQTFVSSLNSFLIARDAAIEQARENSGDGETVEYTYGRTANQPRTSNLRFIAYWHPGMKAQSTANSSSSAKLSQDNEFTFNGAVTFYDNPPAGTGTVRDIQAALGWDHHFGVVDFALAGYYQYQQSAAALQIGPGDLAPGTNIMLPGSAATLLAPKKSLVVGQATITIPLKNGAKVPFGITVANRSELVKGTEVRGHVGFNFDWTSLFAGKSSQ